MDTAAIVTARLPYRLLIIGVILFGSLHLAGQLVAQVDVPEFANRLTLHNQIISGSAVSPFRYRVIVPYFTEAITRLLSPILAPELAFVVAYAVYSFLALVMMLAALYLYLREWFPVEQSALGLLLVMLSVPFTFPRFGYLQHWTLLELALLTLALYVIHKRRYHWLLPLTLAASLNRETGVFIPLAFAWLTAFKDRRRAALLFGVWLAVFAGLRLLRGDAPHQVTLAHVLATNLHDLPVTIGSLALMLGLPSALAVIGYRQAPPFTRRAAWIILPYLATVAAWGIWIEVRLFMPLYPLLVPLALSALIAPFPSTR
jgi:hypothetical protein